MIEAQEFDSSRVMRAEYDKEKRIVKVFWANGGPPYEYREVPSAVWRRMKASASVGKFVTRVLQQYPYGPARS